MCICRDCSPPFNIWPMFSGITWVLANVQSQKNTSSGNHEYLHKMSRQDISILTKAKYGQTKWQTDTAMQYSLSASMAKKTLQTLSNEHCQNNANIVK